MEQGIGTYIRQQFGIGEQDWNAYSPLALAYIGDGIYELVIRTAIVGKENKQAGKLHREVSRYAKAQAQAEMMETLLPMLTQKELEIYYRGRNAKSYTKAKNASVQDYRKATGLETLMGYLYLQDEMPRLVELVREAVMHYTPQEHEGMETRNQEKGRQG